MRWHTESDDLFLCAVLVELRRSVAAMVRDAGLALPLVYSLSPQPSLADRQYMHDHHNHALCPVSYQNGRCSSLSWPCPDGSCGAMVGVSGADLSMRG
jgi:hypothetical protein